MSRNGQALDSKSQLCRCYWNAKQLKLKLKYKAEGLRLLTVVHRRPAYEQCREIWQRLRPVPWVLWHHSFRDHVRWPTDRRHSDRTWQHWVWPAAHHQQRPDHRWYGVHWSLGIFVWSLGHRRYECCWAMQYARCGPALVSPDASHPEALKAKRKR